jgi:hypothetical protein
VNLYPFVETLNKTDDEDEIIENNNHDYAYHAIEV